MAKKIRVVDLVEALFSDLQADQFSEIELVDVKFVKEGPNRYLRVFIDKEGGVTIDDCAAVSRALNKLIDKHDPIEQKYILEVSSPGVERPLKKPADYERFKGELAQLKLYHAIAGSKKIVGILHGYQAGIVTIERESDSERLAIPHEKIASATLVFRFN